MAGPVKTNVDAAITTLDNANIGRTSNAAQHDPASMVKVLENAGMHEEAQMLSNLWQRMRAVLDQASSKANKTGK